MTVRPTHRERCGCEYIEPGPLLFLYSIPSLTPFIRDNRHSTHLPSPPYFCLTALCVCRSRCSRKNAHISLEASMLLLVVPPNHSGSCPPPGQVWPPPSTLYSTTAASSAQFVYSKRFTSTATTDSTGIVAQRFLRAQFAVQIGMLGNVTGETQVRPPWYGVRRSAVPCTAIIGTGRRPVHQLHGKN